MSLRAASRSWRSERGGVVEAGLGEGRGLARAIDGAGPAALLDLLTPEIDAFELEDTEVSVRVDRVEHDVRVRTRWADGAEASSRFPAGPRRVVDLVSALHDPGRTLHLRQGVWWEGPVGTGAELVIPGLLPGEIGSAAFRSRHGLARSGMAGAMAGGIAGVGLVTSLARAGWLGSLGTGGLPMNEVTRMTDEVMRGLSGETASFNLLHNPAEPAMEEATVDLYLERGVRVVEASAFMGLTPAIVRFRLHGLHEADGRIVTPNRVIAKISRPEVAEHFLRPAPDAILTELLARGALTEAQVVLARKIPVADDLTVEADSGGHTDRRPLSVLVPLMRRLARNIATEQGYSEVPAIGAAGGLGDPWSIAGAFALGAAYVVTGSVNQATLEAATSPEVKQMLAGAGIADVGMGPAPDMFEIGAEVQVLSRGTMYAQRASRLYSLYRDYPSIEAIPAADRQKIEAQIFRRPLAEVEAETARYWAARDPREWQRATSDAHHRMALCFRWYLGLTSRWARTGEASRKLDYQVWCGAAMGLFNDWVRGTSLEPLAARGVVSVNEALLRGACVATRVNLARLHAELPAEADRILP